MFFLGNELSTVFKAKVIKKSIQELHHLFCLIGPFLLETFYSSKEGMKEERGRRKEEREITPNI